MKYLGWLTFTLTFLVAIKSVFLTSVDQTNRDLASHVEVRARQVENALPTSDNESLKNLNQIKEAVQKKYN